MSLAIATIPARASIAASDARDRVVERVAASQNPVFVIVLAAAIVVGLGLVAYLTASCISHGYRGFNAVVDISWNNPLNATVKFNCFK
ncbi:MULTISPECIES: hypothetical protein [unclassified Curtobacterium]|uniref:hypothetical protein n=1 Tax=unclassified Curtobacterium TaxID=257496 RepID=UPI0038159C39